MGTTFYVPLIVFRNYGTTFTEQKILFLRICAGKFRVCLDM
jgi:hypothetical protein